MLNKKDNICDLIPLNSISGRFSCSLILEGVEYHFSSLTDEEKYTLKLNRRKTYFKNVPFSPNHIGVNEFVIHLKSLTNGDIFSHHYKNDETVVLQLLISR